MCVRLQLELRCFDNKRHLVLQAAPSRDIGNVNFALDLPDSDSRSLIGISNPLPTRGSMPVIGAAKGNLESALNTCRYSTAGHRRGFTPASKHRQAERNVRGLHQRDTNCVTRKIGMCEYRQSIVRHSSSRRLGIGTDRSG